MKKNDNLPLNCLCKTKLKFHKITEIYGQIKIKNIPAKVCPNCKETYINNTTEEKIEIILQNKKPGEYSF